MQHCRRFKKRKVAFNLFFYLYGGCTDGKLGHGGKWAFLKIELCLRVKLVTLVLEDPFLKRLDVLNLLEAILKEFSFFVLKDFNNFLLNHDSKQFELT